MIKTVDFVNFLAHKYKLPKHKAKTILVWAMKNLTEMIREGEDVQIEKFGKFEFNKEAYASYLKVKQEAKNKKNGKQ
jgi:nucleoid DNA-binding protein